MLIWISRGEATEMLYLAELSRFEKLMMALPFTDTRGIFNVLPKQPSIAFLNIKQGPSQSLSPYPAIIFSGINSWSPFIRDI